MKTYSVFITVILCLVIILGITFLGRYKTMYTQLFLEIESCQQDKVSSEEKLNQAKEQLLQINKTNSVLITVLNSFMIPGDLKAITVGSQESSEIEQKIIEIVDSKDRMIIEQSWNDFKDSKLLNPLFNLLRSGVNNIERILISNNHE
ncbi:MAG: hypothetical protein PHN37_02740 [Candidatus Pacebacteria bacterium]|nr:hypothetical protein [Candidatus Paceibacterota bacterium]